MRENKRVGIFGGTFDPVHNGHINLALELLEKHELDEVWFCPAKRNPLKHSDTIASDYHRLKMLEEAVQPIPYFGVIANEMERDAPSFMVDTLKELTILNEEQIYPNEFFLILGQDSLTNFANWKDPEEIISLAKPLVGLRDIKNTTFHGSEMVKEALNQGITTTKILDISATTIRERLQKGLYVGHLLPAKVVDYILENKLYFTGFDNG